MSASAILSSLLSSAQLASRAPSLVQTPSAQAGGDFEQMLDKYETPAANPSAASTPGSSVLQNALAALGDAADPGSSASVPRQPPAPTFADDAAGGNNLAEASIVATPATTSALAAPSPPAYSDPAKMLAASLAALNPAASTQSVAKSAAPAPPASPGAAPTAATKTSGSNQPAETTTPANNFAVTPPAKAAAKSFASDQTPENAAPTTNAALDIGVAFAAAAPVFSTASAATAPDLAAAAQTIASALAAPTQGVEAPGGEAPTRASPSRARLSAVQTRTHLTVQDSRLFQAASPRTQAALDASSAASSSTNAPTKSAATVAAPPAAEAPALTDADAAPSREASSTVTTLSFATGVGAAAPDMASAPSLTVAELPDRLASEAASLDTQPAARGPVKELQFQLDPADLGTIYVKLRLTTGRLSVDIGVSNPGALAEIENQRDAMTSKLEFSTQPLESLVIHPQAEPPNGASPPTAFFTGADASGGKSRKPARESGQRSSRPAPAADQGAASAVQRGALVV